MNYLSLFSGAMGGDLGVQHLLGWRCLGYVEWDKYCQQLIRQRQEDGFIDRAPIFSDIRAFINQGFATSYKGMVDVITAGFPCQPFSVAGKRTGADDERNMWPATIDCIRRIRPWFAFLENVPGLLSSGYFGTITGDLVESGYDCRWRILSAAEVGAPHKRDRLWIVAYDNTIRSYKCSASSFYERTIAQDNIKQWNRGTSKIKRGSSLQDVPDSEQFNDDDTGYGTGTVCRKQFRQTKIRRNRWWDTEPNVGRVANRVASRVDRIKAIGNGQVPAVAATAWRLLNEL